MRYPKWVYQPLSERTAYNISPGYHTTIQGVIDELEKSINELKKFDPTAKVHIGKECGNNVYTYEYDESGTCDETVNHVLALQIEIPIPVSEKEIEARKAQCDRERAEKAKRTRRAAEAKRKQHLKTLQNLKRMAEQDPELAAEIKGLLDGT